jgi:uncharacterized protein
MGSEGNINNLKRSDFLDDVIAAFDFLSKVEGVDKNLISLVGESFGGYLACIFSSQRPVKDLVLRVPTDFPDTGFEDTPQIELAGHLTREWKMQKHLFKQSYALDALHCFKNNILIVASEYDAYVPLQITKNYLSALLDKNKVEYHLVKGASHAMLNPLKQWKYIMTLYKWLNSGIN